MYISIKRTTIATLIGLFLFGAFEPTVVRAMSKSPVAQPYTDILPPKAWQSVRGYVASGDARDLPRGQWRRYQIDLQACRANADAASCWGGTVLLVEEIYDLATGSAVVDITNAAAARGVTPEQFMTRGHGKPVHLTRIFATKQSDGSHAVFVGRVADDAPNAPGRWKLFCRLPVAKQSGQYYQTELDGLRVKDLISIRTPLCKN